MYEVNGWSKYTEIDNYETGCDPATGTSYHSTDRFTDDNLEALIKKLMDFCDVTDKQSVLLDSCGDIGRLDITVMENELGNEPSVDEQRRWRKGKIKLWYVTYIFRIERVNRIKVNLVELLKNKGYSTD